MVRLVGRRDAELKVRRCDGGVVNVSPTYVMGEQALPSMKLLTRVSPESRWSLLHTVSHALNSPPREERVSSFRRTVREKFVRYATPSEEKADAVLKMVA